MCGDRDVIRGWLPGDECWPVGLITNVWELIEPKLGWRTGDPEPADGVTIPLSTTDWGCVCVCVCVCVHVFVYMYLYNINYRKWPCIPLSTTNFIYTYHTYYASPKRTQYYMYKCAAETYMYHIEYCTNSCVHIYTYTTSPVSYTHLTLPTILRV